LAHEQRFSDPQDFKHVLELVTSLTKKARTGSGKPAAGKV
jgi:hypothetical protein